MNAVSIAEGRVDPPRLGGDAASDVLRALPAGSVVIAHDGTILWAQGITDWLGWGDPGSLAGRSVADFVHPDDLRLAVESLNHMVEAEGPFFPLAYRIRHRDGTWVRTMVWSAKLDTAVFGVQATVHTMQPYDHMIIVEDPLEVLAQGRPFHEVMNAVFAAMGSTMFGFRASFLLFGDDGTVMRAWHSEASAETAPEEATVRTGFFAAAPPPMAGGPLGETAEAWRVRLGATWATELVSAGRVNGVVLMWTTGGRPPIYLRERIGRVLRVAQLAIERDQAEQQLQRLAVEDPLTGLVNRREFMAALQRRLATGSVGVVFADLDSFKPVNDRFGHLVGDEVLRIIGARLRRIAGTRSTAARLGGDEFAILTAPAAADRVAVAVQRSVARPIPTSAGRVEVGTSVGVAIAAPGASPWSVLDAADRAMFQDKRSRSNGAHRLPRWL